jgi:hypothetical protein
MDIMILPMDTAGMVDLITMMIILTGMIIMGTPAIPLAGNEQRFWGVLGSGGVVVLGMVLETQYRFSYRILCHLHLLPTVRCRSPS